MSRKCSTWADKHVVGRDGAQRLLEAIADWCNDDGVTFVGQKKLQYKVAPMPLSSVKANFKYLKDRGYIRTEQRHNPVTKARMTDIIYLNLEKWDTQKISFEEAEEVMKQTGMSLDELMKSPLFLKGAHQHYIDMHSGPDLKNLPGFSNPTQAVGNSVNDQGLENLPGSESVDNMPKSPGLKNLPWSSQVGFTGDQGRFYSSEGGSRVNRNARAQINLKIKDSSISQSVKSSGSVENFDGPTDGQTKLEKENSNPQQPLAPAPEEPGSPTPRTAAYSVTMTQGQQNGQEAHTSAATKPVPAHDRSQRLKQPSAASSVGSGGLVPARSGYAPQRGGNGFEHRGVDIPRVVSTLTQSGMPQVRQVPQQTLVRMIDLVLDRATGVVHSPNRFATAALRNDWFELFSRVEAHQQVRSSAAFGSGGALCRQHRCRLSPAGECKRCVAEQRDTELDELHHELVWKKNLTQIDVATLEISLRRAGYAVEQLPVQYFGQHITAALNSGVAPTNNDLFRYFADNQEIFTHNAASDKEFAGFGHERTA